MSTLDDTPEASMAPEPYEPRPSGEIPEETPERPGATARPAGPPIDRFEPLNLSRRPFLNSRPVVRISLILLVAGLALMLWNFVQFQKYLTESADKRAQITQGEREVARQRQVNGDLERRLAALDLEQMNARVEFLNLMIAERTFSWSLLLDRLADVLPNDVRVVRLSPKKSDSERQAAQSRRRREAAAGPRKIPLGINVETRSDEAFFQLVDNLFAHPAFANPNFTREEGIGEAGELVKFDLSVQYIPGGAPNGVVVEEAPMPEASPGAPGTPGSAPAVPEATPGGARP